MIVICLDRLTAIYIVIVVCLLQAPKFRQLMRRRRRGAAPMRPTVPEPGVPELDKVAAS